MAAHPLSLSSSAAMHLMRDRAVWRSFSLPPSRFCPSCSSGSHCHQYSYSRNREGAGGGAAASGGTLYDVLDLAVGATALEIKQAYRRLARACHPDVAGRGREVASSEEFMRLHTAYTTLSDPNKRAEYDRRMLTASAARRLPSLDPGPSSSGSYYIPPSESSTSPFNSFPRKTWETDQCW